MSLDQLLDQGRNPLLSPGDLALGERRVFADDAEIRHRWSALHAAVRAVEDAVAVHDKNAKLCATNGDYSGAGRNQAAAVDLHCAVAIIAKALFGHDCGHSGFSSAHGDSCAGCELADWRKRHCEGTLAICRDCGGEFKPKFPDEPQPKCCPRCNEARSGEPL